MAQDPTIDLVNKANTTNVRLLNTIADLQRRITALEQARTATLAVQSANPTATLRDGSPIVSSGTPALWVRVGGTWRYTTLT